MAFGSNMVTHIHLDGNSSKYYLISMKTTVELNDVLISQIKQQAREKSTTMKEVMEAALRLYLAKQKASEKQYRFLNRSFKGDGVCDGVEEGAWEKIRSTIYEGRGG